MTMLTPRAHFVGYLRNPKGTAPVVSPFLPHPDVVVAALRLLGLTVVDDPVENEIALSNLLGYQPMFMTEFDSLLFPWKVDEERSDDSTIVSVIGTPRGTWEKKVSRRLGIWGDEEGFPVKTEADHAMLVSVCEGIGERRSELREYFSRWRARVGENGVIVLAHPHISCLSYQIGLAGTILHWNDFPHTYRVSMEAVYRASLVVMEIAMKEGIDFMSDSSFGLEINSPALIEEMDIPWLRRFSAWTHERGGLFWYHNCGHTRSLIREGTFNRIGADIIETIAPPPCGDNDLAESRAWLDSSICSKGNLNLGLLREGTPEDVTAATRDMAAAVRGYAHIYSTADAVLEGTPPQNFIAFVDAIKRFTAHT
jgi:uroporphyrinogen-III decarboxylase